MSVEPEDLPADQADSESQPDKLATLGELLEASHIRFVERVRALQKKGEIE